jgi:rfaE bifunctional protein kinase chain/domain
MIRLTRDRLIEILEACRKVRAGVLGDFNLDAYWYTDMTLSQLSRETPLFPRPVVRETYSPGGAANVAWNLAALNPAQVEAFTVFGIDWRGDLLTAILMDLKVNLDSVLVEKGRLTPLFGKIILMAHESEQEDARLDFTNAQPLIQEQEESLLKNLEARLLDLDVLVIADYLDNGVVTERIRRRLNRLAQDHPGLTWVVDSRQHVGDFRAMVLKPNQVEAAGMFFPDRPYPSIQAEELVKAALDQNRASGQPIVVTMGERGCLLIDRGQPVRLPAVLHPPPVDPVGAGDTFLSALAVCLAAGAEAWEAGLIANLAAGVTVKCLRITGTASAEQIIQQYDALPQAVNAAEWRECIGEM